MADTAMRARLSRMLNGDFRPDDLTRLFLYARDRCDGRETVKEIGDFIAHANERTKGITNQTTRDWATIVRTSVPLIGHKIDTTHLSPQFPEFLRASLRRATPQILRRAKLGRRQASKTLTEVEKNIKKNHDGSYALGPNHSEREWDLIKALTDTIVVRPAFTGDRLFDEFQATMRSLELLKKPEELASEKLKPAVTLLAISLMHNCLIVDSTNHTLKLEATLTGHEIEVIAKVPLPDRDNIFMASAMFISGLNSEWLDESLSKQQPPWNFDLELTGDQRLARLN